MNFTQQYALKLTVSLYTWSKSFGFSGGTAPAAPIFQVGPATIPLGLLAIGLKLEIGYAFGTV